MQDTAKNPTALETALASIDLADLLTGYVARERVGVRYTEISRAAAQFGFEFRHENGNVYGRVRLEPIDPEPSAPVLRLIVRSDHAAVFGSRKRAA